MLEMRWLAVRRRGKSADGEPAFDERRRAPRRRKTILFLAAKFELARGGRRARKIAEAGVGVEIISKEINPAKAEAYNYGSMAGSVVSASTARISKL